MSGLKLDRAAARRFLLAWQGLVPLPDGGGAVPRGMAGVEAFVRRVGCIQYDPLDICGRNHELVLQARVPGYCNAQLERLLYRERRLVEGMDKVMSIYPVEDWPRMARRRRLDAGWTSRGLGEQLSAAEAVLTEIGRRGPLCSLDIEHEGRLDWAWAPARTARAALDHLSYSGTVAVSRRAGTRKYYDLAERLLPSELVQAPDPALSDDDYYDWHVLRRLGGVGFLPERGGDAWVGIPGLDAPTRAAALQRLAVRGEVLKLSVEGVDRPCWLPMRARPLLEAAMAASRPARPRMRLVAPLDNLLWDRRLVAELFGFEYRWEVYTPAAARRYGYYVLPVLWRDRLVARCEPVRERRTGRLLMKGWWWEPDWQPERLPKAERERLLAGRFACLAVFARWLGLEPPQSIDDNGPPVAAGGRDE